jgi:hypothetical protein
VSDIDTAAADSLKALDLEWPIREATKSQRCGKCRDGPWLCENSKIEFADRKFVSSFVNCKNNNAGERCREKTIEKTILRVALAGTFSHSLGQEQTLWPT